MESNRTIKLTVNQVADILENYARDFTDIDFNPNDFYCGIGQDVEERARWH